MQGKPKSPKLCITAANHRLSNGDVCLNLDLSIELHDFKQELHTLLFGSECRQMVCIVVGHLPCVNDTELNGRTLRPLTALTKYHKHLRLMI